MHDLVIKNARIHDGTGTPAFAGSVAVEGGRVSGVGAEVGRGRDEVDAEGLALAPGIIDAHTHYDVQLTWDPYAVPSPLLGVSTVVIGNCGFGIAPCHAEDRDRTLRHLGRVEAMPLEAMRAGVRWDFETFGEYLDMLERRRNGPERRRLLLPLDAAHLGNAWGGDRARRHRRRGRRDESGVAPSA